MTTNYYYFLMNKSSFGDIKNNKGFVCSDFHQLENSENYYWFLCVDINNVKLLKFCKKYKINKLQARYNYELRASNQKGPDLTFKSLDINMVFKLS